MYSEKLLVCWAVAHSVSKAIEQQMPMSTLKTQHIISTAWAFAKVCQMDALLFAALATAAGWCMDSFNPQSIANTAWTFATADHADASLFAALAAAAEWRMDRFNPQELAN